MRKSSLCLALLGVCGLLISLMLTHAAVQRQSDAAHIEHMAAVVRNLELTDLCLFTEARYTRHLSQADLHSAFQDHPMSLEHFPAGSIAGPPSGLRRLNGRLD
jgi:acyl-CoA thioesterase